MRFQVNHFRECRKYLSDVISAPEIKSLEFWTSLWVTQKTFCGNI